MIYAVFDKSGNVVNTIVASPEFVADYCQKNGFTFEEIPEVVPELGTMTPSEQREEAYNTQPIIEWEGKQLTVTQAATKWYYYAAEGSPKADELQALIVAAKENIRTQYPDEEVSA